MPNLNTPTALAVGSLTALSTAMVLLFFVSIPDKNAQIEGAVIGYLAAMAQVAASFYFGSSTSSKEKDQTISVMATKAGTGIGAPASGTTTTTTSTTQPTDKGVL